MRFPRILLLAVVAFTAACSSSPAASPGTPALDPNAPAPIPQAAANQQVAVFAGGCFWCMESDFDKLGGVVATTSGYAGGHVKDPTYEQVGSDTTGHHEAVRVVFDSTKLDCAQVLDWFWHHVDPTDAGGQFCDRGEPYQTAIFPLDAAQEATAKAAKAALDAGHRLPAPVVTEIYPVGTPFYAAENYHQDFHETTPGRYTSYRLGCGRDAKVALLWGI